MKGRFSIEKEETSGDEESEDENLLSVKKWMGDTVLDGEEDIMVKRSRTYRVADLRKSSSALTMDGSGALKNKYGSGLELPAEIKNRQ